MRHSGSYNHRVITFMAITLKFSCKNIDGDAVESLGQITHYGSCTIRMKCNYKMGISLIFPEMKEIFMNKIERNRNNSISGLRLLSKLFSTFFISNRIDY